MKNNAAKQIKNFRTTADGIRNWFGDGRDSIRIIAVSAQNWPELASLGDRQIALGADDLIRLALWSASNCCAALLSTRRATLLLQRGSELREIRCLVVANASLATPRPLSGFLLKPTELRDTSRGARNTESAHRADGTELCPDETRRALFDAFPPPMTAGEQRPPGCPMHS